MGKNLKKIIAVLIFSIATIGLWFLFQTPVPTTQLNQSKEQSSFSYRPEFGLTDLKNLIDEKNVTTIEELLPLLPEALRSNYTLVKESQSRIQGASLQDPRAVLFGNTARLVLTFNGNPSQPGYQSLEAMEFDLQKGKFELREINFSENAKPQWSEPNPKKCTVCHGSNPRPIWDSYRTWPSAYGEDDDKEKRSTMQAFRKYATHHPRYRNLKQDPENQCFPYHCDNTARSFYLMPNLRFTYLSVLNNSVAISRQVQRSSNYNRFKYSLVREKMCIKKMATVLNFTLLSFSIPTSVKKFVQFAEIPKDEIWVLSHKLWEAGVTESDALNAFGIPYGNTNLKLKAKDLRFLIGNSSEVTHTGVYAAGYMNTSSNHHAIIQILNRIAEEDANLQSLLDAAKGKSKFNQYGDQLYTVSPEFADYEYQLNYPFNPDSICEYLAQKSESELKAAAIETRPTFVEFQPTAENPVGRELLAQAHCIACHQQPPFTAIPQIPFGDAREFSEYVSFQKSIGHDALKSISSQIRKRSMPLTAHGLGEFEHKAIMEYLHSIAH